MTMEKTLPDKGILEKTNKKKEELGLLYNHQQSWNPKQTLTLKQLRTYINPKSVH